MVAWREGRCVRRTAKGVSLPIGLNRVGAGLDEEMDDGGGYPCVADEAGAMKRVLPTLS